MNKFECLNKFYDTMKKILELDPTLSEFTDAVILFNMYVQDKNPYKNPRIKDFALLLDDSELYEYLDEFVKDYHSLLLAEVRND